MSDQEDADVSNTWTDGLNRALAPLDLLLSGEDASGFLPVWGAGGALATFRALTEEDYVRIAAKGNAYLEIDRVTPAHIAEAVAYTLWNWTE